MIIKASSKDYEVTVNNNFDVIEKLQIDKDTYVVIDKKIYNMSKDYLIKFQKINYIFLNQLRKIRQLSLHYKYVKL